MRVVLDLAERKEKEALEVLGKAKSYRDAQSAQLLNLKEYHSQYLNDMKPELGGVSSVNQLQANLQFVNQIDLAIQQQEQILTSAENQFAKALADWQLLHQKKKGLVDLIERYRSQEQTAADKLEQKLIEDMHLARSFRR